MTRKVPVWYCLVERTEGVEMYVAAETMEEANEIAGEVARSEVDWWDSWPDYDVTVWPNSGRQDPLLYPQKDLDDRGGIWVQAWKRWVSHADELPDLAPKPDPNQLVLDL